MRGPYRVTKVLPNGRYELKLLSGSKGKSTQAAAQHMVPWKGEWCPETCAMFFDDGNHTDDDDVIPENQRNSDESAIPGPSMPILEDEDQEGGHTSGTPLGGLGKNMVEDEPESGEAE